MTTTAEVQKVNAENVEQALDDVRAKLAGTEGGVILDFSGVPRVDHSGYEQSKTSPMPRLRSR